MAVTVLPRWACSHPCLHCGTSGTGRKRRPSVRLATTEDVAGGTGPQGNGHRPKDEFTSWRLGGQGAQGSPSLSARHSTWGPQSLSHGDSALEPDSGFNGQMLPLPHQSHRSPPIFIAATQEPQSFKVRITRFEP